MAQHLGEGAECEGFVEEYSEEVGVDGEKVFVDSCTGRQRLAQHGAKDCQYEPDEEEQCEDALPIGDYRHGSSEYGCADGRYGVDCGEHYHESGEVWPAQDVGCHAFGYYDASCSGYALKESCCVEDEYVG